MTAGQAGIGAWTQTTTNLAGRTEITATDYFGKVKSRTDFGGHITTYAYNLAGQVTDQDSTSGQSLDYAYTTSGQLARLTDNATKMTSLYAYDSNGNRTQEVYYYKATSLLPVYYENAVVTYDALNRVTKFDDNTVDITYAYDANGNRRRVTGAYIQPGTSGLNQDFWYKYDSLDRFTLTKGTLSGGAIVKGTTGTDITYNDRGDRMSATYGSDGHVEQYTYTADGYLQTITTGGVLGAGRTIDLLGRVTTYTEYQSNGSSVLATRSMAYDGDNRVTAETDITYGSGVTYTSQITNDYRLLNGSTYTGLDQGVLTHTRKVQSQSGSSTTTTIDSDYDYVWWGQAKTSVISIKANSAEWLPGKSTFAYDVNGNLKSNQDGETNGISRSIDYVTDAFGQVMTRQEWNYAKPGAKRTYFYLNGRTLGDVGTDKDSNVDYAQQLATNRANAANAGTTTILPTVAATPVVGLNGNFDANYDAFNPSSVAQAGSAYTAVGGEGLQAAALSIWGDASLWYLLAEANGLGAGVTLVAGQVLSVPNAVSNVHNSSETFKPYNAAEAQGNTLPTLPRAPLPPVRNQGCGVIGEIIATVVSMVVQAVVTFYAGPELGAAAGEYSRQYVQIAVGNRKRFDFAAIAAAFVGATIEQAVGAGNVGRSIIRQSTNMAFGVQKNFDWANLAVAAVSGAVTNGVSTALPDSMDQIGKIVVTGTASLLAGAATRTILTRDSFGENLAKALPEALANTVGDMISEAIVGEMQKGRTDDGTLSKHDRMEAMLSGYGKGTPQRTSGLYAYGYGPLDAALGGRSLGPLGAEIMTDADSNYGIGSPVTQSDAEETPVTIIKGERLRWYQKGALGKGLYFTGGLIHGAFGELKDMAVGIGTLAYDFSPAGQFLAVAQWSGIVKKEDIPAWLPNTTRQIDPFINLGKGIYSGEITLSSVGKSVDNYLDGWGETFEKGDYKSFFRIGNATGHTLVFGASMFVGVGEIASLGKAGEATSGLNKVLEGVKTADKLADGANIASHADEVAIVMERGSDGVYRSVGNAATTDLVGSGTLIAEHVGATSGTLATKGAVATTESGIITGRGAFGQAISVESLAAESEVLGGMRYTGRRMDVRAKFVDSPSAQVSTPGHSFASRKAAYELALDPDVERVTMNAGYKRLLELDDSVSLLTVRPDAAALYLDRRIARVEILSDGDRLPQILIDRNTRLDPQLKVLDYKPLLPEAYRPKGR